MKREDLYLTIAIAIPLLICLISYWFCVYYPAIVVATKESGFEQWLGFFGTIVGAGVTLIAATIAWMAVQKQIDTQREGNLLSLLIREEERGEAQMREVRVYAAWLNRAYTADDDKKPEEYSPRLKEIGLDADSEVIRRSIERDLGPVVHFPGILLDTATILSELMKATIKWEDYEFRENTPEDMENVPFSLEMQRVQSALIHMILDLVDTTSQVHRRVILYRKRIDRVLEGL